jgi:hypothetical protein
VLRFVTLLCVVLWLPPSSHRQKKKTVLEFKNVKTSLGGDRKKLLLPEVHVLAFLKLKDKGHVGAVQC